MSKLDNYGINCKNAIIVIDEGHNITEVAEEGYSATITLNNIYSVV